MKRCYLAAGSAELIRASREAQTGADALVPPFGAGCPSRVSEYSSGPANAATSGTIRPLMDRDWPWAAWTDATWPIAPAPLPKR